MAVAVEKILECCRSKLGNGDLVVGLTGDAGQPSQVFSVFLQFWLPRNIKQIIKNIQHMIHLSC